MHGRSIAHVLVRTPGYVPGLAGVTEELMALTSADVMVFGAAHDTTGSEPKSPGRRRKGGGRKGAAAAAEKAAEAEAAAAGGADAGAAKAAAAAAVERESLSVITRAHPRATTVDLNAALHPFGGGGHAKAAAASVTMLAAGAAADAEHFSADAADGRGPGAPAPQTAEGVVRDVVARVAAQIPAEVTARSFMTPVVYAVTPDMTMAEAKEFFARRGLKSTPVADPEDRRLRGALKLSDIAKCERAGRLRKARVREWMRSNVATVSPDAPLAELEEILVLRGIGRLAVTTDDGVLIGLITRTDVLRQRNLYDSV